LTFVSCQGRLYFKEIADFDCYMIHTQSRWSLYWWARHKPYWIVLLTAGMLIGSFPPSSLNPLIFIAFVPLFILVERNVVPEKVPEDQIFRPFKSFFIIIWRLATLQFLWRPATRYNQVFSYRRKLISGNAQLFRYTYTIFLFWNVACCYWLSLTVIGANNLSEGIVYGTAGLLAMAVNPMLMALPFQFFSRIRWVLTPAWAGLCFICFWITFEYLHLNWELSWSWLNLGHALASWPKWIQYAEITGTLGITLHILLCNYSLYLCYRRFHQRRKSWRLWLGGGIGLLLLPFALNLILLHPDREILQSHASLRVRVVQPSVDPYFQENYYTPEEQVALLVELSQQEGIDSVDLLVYPETAISRAIYEDRLSGSRLLKPIWSMVDSFEVDVLTGLESYRTYPAQDSAPVSARLNAKGLWMANFNAATMLRKDREKQAYHKGNRVPFVEHLPYFEWFTWLEDWGIPLSRSEYAAQDSLNNLVTSDSISIGVMICYDSQFGDQVRVSSKKGAEMLAIVTNDSWWGPSSGYIQHASLSTLRAIENRREVARSANTGRSLFVDAKGHPHQETDWMEVGVIDREIKLYKGTTFYARHGDYVGRFAMWGSILIIILGLAYVMAGRREAPASRGRRI